MSDEVPAPTTARAMKAVLTDERFSDPDWVFERKLDGIRCVAIRDGDGVRLLSRNDLPLTDRFREVADALAGPQPHTRFAVDGEIVAFDGEQTSFEALQQGHTVVFCVFDVQWLDGRDVRPLPLLERKALLRETLTWTDPLRFTEHEATEGEALFEHACANGWEGVIAKRADAPYTDKRSKAWLKFKCEAGQELVVGGFTAPKGSRTGFGALLVGHYDGGELRYAGKVGTGFDQRTLDGLAARLHALEQDDPPFADPRQIKERAIWVRPELVAQIGFAEWTRDGRLRHPRFQGLREDKAAADVRRET